MLPEQEDALGIFDPADLAPNATVGHISRTYPSKSQWFMEMAMTEAQIKHMVDRFLGWKLPTSFTPDAGISFKAAFNEHAAHPMKHEPSGTNLFDVNQATAMVRYMIEGMPR